MEAELTIKIKVENLRIKADRQFTCEVQYELNGLRMSEVAVANVVENGE